MPVTKFAWRDTVAVLNTLCLCPVTEGYPCMTLSELAPDAMPSFLGDREKFARDVVVNVIANLVAASIIYLIGALIGLLPRSSAALAIASMTVLAGSGLGLLAADGIIRSRYGVIGPKNLWRRQTGKRISLAVLLLGCGGIVFGDLVVDNLAARIAVWLVYAVIMLPNAWRLYDIWRYERSWIRIKSRFCHGDAGPRSDIEPS